MRLRSAKCHNNLAFTTILSVFILNACTVGPDYQRPTTATPATFVQASHPEFSELKVETAWWKLFKDAQLTHLVEQTILHNHDLQAAQANLREARALYMEAGLNLAPSVTTHANYNDQQRSVAALNNRTFVPRDLKLYNLGFDAFWEIDLFGRVQRNVEASNHEVDAVEADLRDLSVSLIAEVARNYFECRGLQQQLDIIVKNAENQAQTLAVIRVKLTNGRGSELDAARTAAQLDATRASLPPLHTAIGQALHRLSVLTGQVPGALTQQLTIPAASSKAPSIIQIGRPAELLRRRPDIRSAELALAASTARIGVATADLFPRVTFVGTIALESNSLSGLGAAGADSYSLGPRISWAALDLGRVYARIKAADAHAEASLAHYQQTVLNALEETENALLTYNQARARQSLLTTAAQASSQANSLAHLRFEKGAIDFLPVLDTELSLLQDQNQLAQSEKATALALVAVYKALGGGWDTAVGL
ncbi:MAG: efflux transporter outer membrane subunit [Methylococcales bacterium]